MKKAKWLLSGALLATLGVAQAQFNISVDGQNIQMDPTGGMIISGGNQNVWASPNGEAGVSFGANQGVWASPGGEVGVRGFGADVTVGGNGNVAINKNNRIQAPTGWANSGVNAENVTITNGRIWIGGTEIPPGVTYYKSPQTGQSYHIRRNGKNISVTEAND